MIKTHRIKKVAAQVHMIIYYRYRRWRIKHDNSLTPFDKQITSILLDLYLIRLLAEIERL